MTLHPEDPRQKLPAVSRLLETPRLHPLITRAGRPIVTEAIRAILEAERTRLAQGNPIPTLEALAETIAARVEAAERQRPHPVINATGIILHTGLGRAVLPKEAVHALAQLDECCNLQIDMETGARGKRNHTLEQLICRLTGAEAALIVNNNAAATLLILAALCKDKEVIVSRGQLIEIGGSFRLPDCVHQSGAILVEVGTTNKTHPRDYQAAITPNTGAILRVNPSNYRVIGFTQDVSIRELASLNPSAPYLVIDDLGCGALIDLTQFGLPHEPTVQDSITAGADLVCFSGDKLISGPQAGIIAGRRDLIARLKKHPLTRMLRVCKLTAVALEHTLRLFLEPETLPQRHPTLRMLATTPATLRYRASVILENLSHATPAFTPRAIDCTSAMGGGSLPGVPIPSAGIALQPGSGFNASALTGALRQQEPPVIAHIENDEVIIDLRTVSPIQDTPLAHALNQIAANLGSPSE